MNQSPKTIEELKQWYIDRNLPSENVTRFFIGKDYKGAKAFGIYKDEITEKYIVYKNKADGTRSIRYEGVNEAYAVNELYKKLKSEIYNQKHNNPKNYNRYETRNKSNYNKKRINLISPLAFVLIYIVFIVIIAIFAVKAPRRGYYNYNNNYYYHQNGSWYQYNKYDSWIYTTVPKELEDNHSTYYRSSNYDYSYDIDNFEYSGYYEEPTSSSSSSDYDSDWDSGSSWDSSYTDWDSDW